MKTMQSPLAVWREGRSISWAASQLGVARSTYYHLERDRCDVQMSIVSRIRRVTGLEWETLAKWFGKTS